MAELVPHRGPKEHPSGGPPSANHAPLLVVEELKRYFVTRQGTVRAVDGVSFSVDEGETLGLIGESGSGKSTVAYTILGVYAPTAGRIAFRGRDIGVHHSRRPRSLKREVQIVFQNPGSSLNPRCTAGQILELPLRVHGNLRGREALRQRVAELLDMVGLAPEYIHKAPAAMGGGERQMVAIARAIATNPSLVVLDEPTSSLDVSMQARILRLLMRLQRQLRLTYLFISHDLSLMRNVASRVAIMYLGKVCEIARTDRFFDNPLHPYTRMLLSSVPVVSASEERLKPTQVISTGEIPSPVNVPPGCSFHTRCPLKMSVCTRVDPGMVEPEPGHWVRCHLFGAGGTA